LITAGAVTYFYRYENSTRILQFYIPMLIVFALGIQNAYGRLSQKEILSPTTVMTGNVTQLLIDLTNFVKLSDQSREQFSVRIINGMYVILPFLMGCICGGLITKYLGFGSAVFAGILILAASANKKAG
jgi:uncharacterized membrane protein YoaK (UPF0700 family)